MAFGLSIPSIMGSGDDNGFSLSPDLLAQVRQMMASAPAAGTADAGQQAGGIPLGPSPAAPQQQSGAGDGQGAAAAPPRAASNMPGSVAQALSAAAQRYPDFAQAHPDYLQSTARIESSFNPDAYNKSGAAGLYQFMPKTAAAFGLSNPYDPSASADAATRLAIANGKTLTGVLGREPTDGELYLAHQQGAGGASKLLSNPDARAVDTVGYKAVVQNGGSPGMTNQQFANLWINKVNGAGPGSTAAPAAFGLSGPTQVGSAGSRLPADGASMSAPSAAPQSTDTTPSFTDAMKSLGGMSGGGDGKGGQAGQKQKASAPPLMQPARPRPFSFLHPMQFAGQNPRGIR